MDPIPTTHRWTFLTNHAHVLIVLHGQPDLVLREVAVRVGITERAVQRIVQELEEEGFLRREKVGRQNHYHVITDQPLRHPIEAHRDIGDLLELITKAGSGGPL
nr:helix-turn-helix domain-containing protein [Crateriforma spongiae]